MNVIGLTKPLEQEEIHMRHLSEEDLQLLITLDDPWDAQEKDTFNLLRAENIVAWPGKPFPATWRYDRRTTVEALFQ
jgi:hypothetical protein